MPTSADGTGPPSTARPRLTRAAVLAGAMALADGIGVEPLTIRRLAEHLGVKPMAIYHHVASKEEILDGMVDLVFTEIALPSTGTHWKDAVRVRATSARDVLVRHRWAVPLLESRTHPGPATLAHHEAMIGCLRGAGFPMAMVAHAYALIDAFVYGFVLQQTTMPFDTAGGSPEETAELMAGIMAAMPEDGFPHLVAFATEHVLQPGYSFAAEFDFGLDLILDGLEQAAARSAPGA